MRILKVLSLVFATFLVCAAGHAEEVVDLGGGLFGGGRALLNKPAGKARAGLVLLTGGDGYVGIGSDGSAERGGNWIIRTRGAYARSGIASIALDANADPAKAVEYMRAIAPRVIVVAMSRGALKVAGSLSAKPDGIVFASSMLDEARGMIGDPGRLPPTLIIHHKQDSCRARLLWIDGGTSTGNPCRARAYHGFIGREGQVVSAITGFAGSLR